MEDIAERLSSLENQQRTIFKLVVDFSHRRQNTEDNVASSLNGDSKRSDTRIEASETGVPWSPEGPAVKFPLNIERAREVMQRRNRGDALESRIATATTSFVQQWPSIQTMVQTLFPGPREGYWVPRESGSRDTPSVLPLSTPCPDTRGHVSTPAPSIDLINHPRLDENSTWDCTTQKYVLSFKENVLNIYPIIIPEELDAIVTAFFWNSSNPRNGRVKTGNKRKRSSTESEPSYFPSLQTHPLRNTTKAFIMLVLALGKFCQCKLPDVRDSPSIRSSAGPLSLPHAWGLPSPDEGEREASRRPSLPGAVPMDRGTCSYGDNLGVPGIEYFDAAMKLIGDQLGGYTLEHVQVYILASLYYGQLGCVQEGANYISLASDRLRMIIAPYVKFYLFCTGHKTDCTRRLPHLKNLASQAPQANLSKEDNVLALVFWCCVQLER